MLTILSGLMIRYANLLKKQKEELHFNYNLVLFKVDTTYTSIFQISQRLILMPMILMQDLIYRQGYW